MEKGSGPNGLGPLTSAADEFLVLDLQGRIVAANEAACRSLDRSLPELRDLSVWDVCTCLTPDGFEHAVEAMRAEGPQSLRSHLRRRDGTLASTDVRLWTAEHEGEPRVMALARELRGSQVIEERDQLASLVETSSELVAMLDGEGRTTFLNAAGRRLLGIEREQDAVGLALSELFVREERALLEETVLPRMQEERWEGDLTLRSWSDGSPTPCRAQGFAVRHSRTRKLIGLALVARDTSAQRLAEERRGRLLRLTEVSREVATKLLASDDLNQAVFQILSEVSEALGAARGTMIRFRDGRSVYRTHEWSPREGPVHRRGAQAESWEDQRRTLEVLQRGECLRVTSCEPAPDGEDVLIGAGERALLALPALIHGALRNVFVFTSHSPREWADEDVAAVRIIVDSFARGVERQIAEREKVEARRALEEAVERERIANRYKSEFLASMSHELRTPMNAIRGYAELLSRPQADRSVQEIWIRNLRRSTEYLLGLIHDVLDLSKIEAGHMRLEREPASLAEILGSVEDLLAAVAREKCLDFQVVIDGELPESLETDPVRLKQILVNLTGNAIKFTQTGSVAVRARRKDGGREGGRLVVDVVDTGIGIPTEAIPKLFRPFSQVSQRSGGTGLGLQISRSLARLLGGDITVRSEVGQGSTFTLEVPLVGARGSLRSLPPRATAAPTARPLPEALHRKRILVVDDSLENREVLRFLLQEAGAACETAMNGRVGIERALAAERAHAPFDAILMDMNMPVMDGFEATRGLVKAGVTSPVIALTALALSGDEDRCREAGCVAYIGKPIVPGQFFDTLAKHVRGHARPDPVQRPASCLEAAGGNVLSLAQHPRFRALVDRYVASFPELVKRIRLLERQGQLDEVRTLVHRLRGTAASYGFPGVSQAAGRCEDVIRAGAPRAEVSRTLQDLLGRLALAQAG